MNKLKSKIMRRVAAVILSGAMILPNMTVYSAEVSSNQDAQMISEANVDEGTAETVNDEYSKSKDEKDSANEETTEESNETLSTVEETIIEDETTTEGVSEDETTTEEVSEDETTTEGTSEDETTTEGASEDETTTEEVSEDETTNNEVIEDPNNENNITILIQPRNSYAAQTLDVTDENELKLVYEKGIWYCYENGKWNPNYYGIVDYGGSKFLVAHGVVANISGLCECNGKWYYMSRGQVQTQYTGLAYYDGEWFYVENGILDTSKGGIVKYDTGLFLISAGRVRYDYSGLFQDTDGTWYFLSNGQVQTQYTGLVQYDGQWFRIDSGKLDNTYEGYTKYDGSVFYVVNGQVVFEHQMIDTYNNAVNDRTIYADEISDVLSYVNQFRAEVGVEPLNLDEDICVAACIRAQEMADNNVFSHTRPNGSRWVTVLEQLELGEYVWAENIARGYNDAYSVSYGWYNSPGHYANMINSDLNNIGIGVAKAADGTKYWVQLFTD
jgi:uncharacterized protein YkwD